MKLLGPCLFFIFGFQALLAGEFKTIGGKDGRVFSLTPDLTFGTDEDEDAYIWASASTSITADHKGHIFIGDGASKRVLEFDEKGGYLRTVMGPGQGPGELVNLLDFKVLTSGAATSIERVGQGITARMQHFDPNMKYSRSQSGSLILEGPVLSPQGDRFAAFYVSHDRKSGLTHYQTALFSSDFKPIKIFTDKTGPLPDRSKISDPGYWATRLGDNLKRFYSGVHVFNFDREGRLYSARTDRYEVIRWSLDLKKEKAFKREYRPVPNSDEEIAAYMESLSQQVREDPDLAAIVSDSVMERAVKLSEPPPVKNPIFGMVVTSEGTLLVIHDVNLVTRESTADVFTAEGQYVGAITLPDFAFVRPLAGLYLPKMVFRNGFAYTILTDDKGDNRAVRYRVSLK